MDDKDQEIERLKLERDQWHQAFSEAVKREHDLRRELDHLKDKALRFDLDAAGISQREQEAVELVELRSEHANLRREVERLQGVVAVLKNQIAEYLEYRLEKSDG